MTLARPSSAEVIRVAADGSGDFLHLWQACEVAEADDVISVAPGSYNEGHPDGSIREVVLSEVPLTIRGTSFDPDAVLIGYLRLFFHDCAEVRIRHLSFTASGTPVRLVGGDHSILNCVFYGNAAGAEPGGAVRAIGSATRGISLRVEKCEFRQNTSSSVGGAIYGGNLTLVESLFTENESSSAGGAVYTYDNLEVVDCVFAGNYAPDGSGIDLIAGVWIEGCTFWGNRGGSTLRVTGYDLEPENTITRSIVAGAIGGYGIWCAGLAEITCCNLWGNEMGNFGMCEPGPRDGVIYLDPRFCNAESGDFHLMSDSPCLPGWHGGMVCDLMGAFGAACGSTPTLSTTWGRLKARYGGR